MPQMTVKIEEVSLTCDKCGHSELGQKRGEAKHVAPGCVDIHGDYEPHVRISDLFEGWEYWDRDHVNYRLERERYARLLLCPECVKRFESVLDWKAM